MGQTFEFEELDEASKAYLASAKENRAAGLPGVVLEESDATAMFAFIFGLIVLVATVIITVPSLEDPNRTAMLQTAGLLFGGWFVLVALRIWRAQGRGTNLGSFWYADANFFWRVTGPRVTVYPLAGIGNITTKPTAGSTSKMTVTLQTEDGPFSLTGCDIVPANLFVDFINTMKELKEKYPDAADWSASTLGYNAAQIARTGQFPAALDRSASGLLSLVPIPQRVNPPSSGLLAIAVILAAGVGIFYGSKNLNTVMRDDAAFDHARAGGAIGLRVYLFDDRNVRHRDDAEQLLNQAFDKAILTVLSNDDATKPAREAFAKILDRLRTDKKALLPICVHELVPADSKEGDFAESNVKDRERAMAEALQNRILSTLEPGLVAVYETSEEGRSYVEFSWKLLPRLNQTNYDVQWSMVLRDGNSEKPTFATTDVFRNQLLPNPIPTVKMALDLGFNQALGREIPMVQLNDD